MALLEDGSLVAPPLASDGDELAARWRRLNAAAMVVALLFMPVAYVWLSNRFAWPVWLTLVASFFAAIALRGTLDVLFRRFLPWPQLFGSAEEDREGDVVARRRVWFWSFWLRVARFFFFLWLINLALVALFGFDLIARLGPLIAQYGPVMMIFFLINFLILMGPMLIMGISQIKAFEPGDANWGVKLGDVRGQAEPKEEIRRVVSLWQSGEMFEEAGGKRERGLLFLGGPGTGKTMLAKAIATGFNCPFIAIPGSGFAQTFIGVDAIIVRYLAWKAKRLARKWGGQCIVFIDEIDAVGMRRASLGGAPTSAKPLHDLQLEDVLFYGPMGARNPSGDLVCETAAWRERVFAERSSAPPAGPFPVRWLGSIVNYVVPGGMMGGGGGLALNQLLIVMDGIGGPRFTRRVVTNRFNTFLDAIYVVPRRLGSASLRLPPARPTSEQIYFIGACNVPIASLDPALTRPGRMGRHIWFRTPTKDDRKDIFDLYLEKVAHEPDMDTPRRRDELARLTSGYSPAMIEQVCSMALTVAHHDRRERFGWHDLVEALTTVESGTALNLEYVDTERRAIAIHEAGHAVCGHVFKSEFESTRLSIRRRGSSGGHHQMRAKDERFSQFQSELIGDLVWGLGAMAAERVFYGENSQGVGGDVGGVTSETALMVGVWGMLPERVDLEGQYVLQSEEDASREKIVKRFEDLGLKIMNRATGGAQMGDVLGAVLSDPFKKMQAAQIIGQAYVIAHNTVVQNQDAIAKVADALEERRELYGDEVVELLDSLNLVRPEIDLTEERSWPKV